MIGVTEWVSTHLSNDDRSKSVPASECNEVRGDAKPEAAWKTSESNSSQF